MPNGNLTHTSSLRVKSQTGFTLFEIMVASVVIVIGIIGMVGTFSNLLVLGELNREKTLAVVHGQFLMETIQDEAFTTLEVDINNGDFDYTSNDLTANPFNFNVLLNETVDTQVVSGGNPLHISVTVTWQDRMNNIRIMDFETLKTN